MEVYLDGELSDGVGEFNRKESVYSQVSRHSDPDQLMDHACFSRQCTEIDGMALAAMRTSAIQEVVKSVALECKFCVSVGDPRRDDCPLIAISDEFETMTGYSRQELIGNSCRLLNANCGLSAEYLSGLRASCSTGEPFTKVLLNRKKSGELFLNLVDLRGLVVATDPRTSEELWFLIGIQADVTPMDDEDIPEDHLPSFQKVVNNIRSKIVEELSTLALSSAMLATANLSRQTLPVPDIWWVLPEARIRPSQAAQLPCDMTTSIPSENHRQTSGVSSSQHRGVARQTSPISDAFFAGLGHGSLSEFIRDESIAVDSDASLFLQKFTIKEAISAAVSACTFCVSIAEVRDQECPIIATSKAFETMSGYSSDEIRRKSFSFLYTPVKGDSQSESDSAALRHACSTGAPFNKILLCRRKSGELFLSLVDMRGLTVARNPRTSEDLWFLIGIQADVSHIPRNAIAENHAESLHKVACAIREHISDRLSVLALAGTFASSSQPSQPDSQCVDLWCPCTRAQWRPAGIPVCKASSAPCQESVTPTIIASTSGEESHGEHVCDEQAIERRVTEAPVSMGDPPCHGANLGVVATGGRISRPMQALLLGIGVAFLNWFVRFRQR